MVTMSEQGRPQRTVTLPHLDTSNVNSIIQQALSSNDKSSMQGKFGWTVFNNSYIPYVLRRRMKFVSLLIMRTKFFDAFQKYFAVELYTYFEIDLQKMTKAEAELLNEINLKYSDHAFDEVMFKADDKLIGLKDAIQLYDFLYFSYEKLIRRHQTTVQKITPCGFMRINKQNCIPFVRFTKKNYVPLFYIDGECKYLQERAVEMKLWPLAYLKLCCKIHGVKKAIYKDNSMTVVDMDLVKKYYPEGTAFEECWPCESHAQSLIAPRYNKNEQITSQPNSAVKHVPYRDKSVVAPYPIPKRAKANWKQNLRQAINHKIDIEQTSVQNTSQYSTSNPIRPSPPPYPGTKEQSAKTNSQSFDPDPNKLLPIRRVQIPAYEGSGSGIYPYKIFKVPLGNTSLRFCVNMEPYDFKVKLVTVGELMRFVPTSLTVFVKAVDYLNIEVYLPNEHQKKLLTEYNVDRTVGLLEVNTVRQRMSDIRDACLRFCVPPLQKDSG